MNKTVIQYVLSRLHDIGIKDIFGVAGDFAFPIHDAICSDRNLALLGIAMNSMPPMSQTQGIMTPENCIAETERLIAAALHHRRPVYMGFPSDYANMPVVGESGPVACGTAGHHRAHDHPRW
jgi:TPP-dependent 2-oxoacid decarboxylase